MAEEVGFEPTDPVQGLLFSRQVQSATLPLFQNKKDSSYAMRVFFLKEIVREIEDHSL